MIDYAQALRIIAATVQPLPVTALRLHQATGAVAAADVACPGHVPPFDNSAMDGFAVRAADTRAASPDAPVELRVLGLVTAGEACTEQPAPAGSAWEIMTGAPLPPGYDSVVPIEQVSVQRAPSGQPLTVHLRQAAEAGNNLRRAGEDFARGTRLLHDGALLTPGRIMGLAATGVASVPARQLPRVAAITTGNELTDADASLEPGRIHDSNGPYLAAAIGMTGGHCIGVRRSGDAAEELIAEITALQAHTDIILTTGGVSAGRMDFVPRALEQIGADILFHRVAIRPGKPILFARLPDGTLVFGLPGNPIAVAVGLRFFVTAALRQMRGLPPEVPLTARLVQAHRKKAGLTFFAKSRAQTDAGGVLRVEVLPGQESFKISPLMQANCWLIGGENDAVLAADSPQSIVPMQPDVFD